jgi:hypothetical protein
VAKRKPTDGPKKKLGRPRLSEEEKHARKIEKARAKVQSSITRHLPPEQTALYTALAVAPDFDISTLWRLTMVEISQISAELEDAKIRNAKQKTIDILRRRLAGYLETARKLALTAKEIEPAPVSSLDVNHSGLISDSIYTDEDGNFIPPPVDDDGGAEKP